mmetsp:Transcript_49543/g.150280  ORF Transcript_49543/g.150280 Transcript_49543/m.150280 type:complete len:109 (+) Transcript_49543:469-795(+)
MKTIWDEEAYIKGLSRVVWALVEPPALLLLMTPPPLYPGSGTELGMRIASVLNEELPRRVLPALAQEMGAELVDTFSLLGGLRLDQARLMQFDGIHPDVEGHLGMTLH